MKASHHIAAGLGLLIVLFGLTDFGSVALGQSLQANAKGRGDSSSRPESSSRRSSSSKPALPTKGTDGVANADTDSEIYRIGVEDELQISVWREPELSVSVVVRPDGKITMPLLNDIAVIGLRTEELQSLLTERLKSVINDPQVTIIVRQIRSRKVYLFGEVIRPGTYSLNARKSVLELLAEGGGFTPFAHRDSIYILRKTKDGKQVRVPFDYKKALSGHSENMGLLPGDVVVVR